MLIDETMVFLSRGDGFLLCMVNEPMIKMHVNGVLCLLFNLFGMHETNEMMLSAHFVCVCICMYVRRHLNPI